MKLKRPGMAAVACFALAMFALAGRAQAVDVTLIWTSPGDDGLNGTASAYDIRYSTSPIDNTNFPQATRLLAPPAPRPAGSLQFCVVKGLLPNADYWFALKTADERGNWSGLSNIAVHTSEKLGVEVPVVPLSFSGPWPNPVTDVGRFALSLPQASRVRIEAYDIGGRRVATLADGDLPAGKAEIAWSLRDASGRRVSPGVYLVRAQLGAASFNRRVVVTH